MVIKIKLKELKEKINSLPKRELEREVAVKIYGVYATEPRVAIKDVYLGFDWAHNVFMLVPEKDLTLNIKK